MNPALSLMILAYNEEKHLPGTLTQTYLMLSQQLEDFEIIIVNDGSTDQTGPVADAIAATHPSVKVIHHPVNLGYGAACRSGLQAATKEYFSWLSGDTVWRPQMFQQAINTLESCDFIITYNTNTDDRPWIRRVISRAFTSFLNTLFRLKFNYYNGASFYKSGLLKALSIHSQGYSFWAEANIKLAKAGYTFKQIATIFPERKYGSSKAFRFNNMTATIKFIFVVLVNIYGPRSLNGLKRQDNLGRV